MFSKYCSECGEAKLSFFPYYVNQGSAQDGRLRLHEVSCQYVLGCEYCSHTEKVLSNEEVSNILNMFLTEDE